MSTLINRTLQHPHLAPWTDDYPNRNFTVLEYPQATNQDGTITVTLRMVTDSTVLSELIQNGQAAYAAVVACTRTFSSHTAISATPELTIKLPAASYHTDFTITPHILALTELHLPLSHEHAGEYHFTRPDGFDLPPGSILATSELIEYPLGETDATSVIDLVTSDRLTPGQFAIVLDDNRIKILVTPDDLTQIARSRQANPKEPRHRSLFATYYQAALREAIGELPKYSDRQWSTTLIKALASLGMDEAATSERALEYAQRLLSHPTGALLAAFTELDREES